jgi:prophage maintenance system killer protein
MNKKLPKNKGQIIIYQNKPGEKAVDVRLEKETIWLDARQIALIFDVNRPAIVKHINNIYNTGELEKKSTCSILEQVAADGKMRKINMYNLDMIISVGYRVNSKKATQFRVWATGILKKYLSQGYLVNKKVIAENYDKFIATVEDVKKLLPVDKNLDNDSILELVKTFAGTWLSLDAYDRNELQVKKVTKRKVKLTAEEINAAIGDFKNKLVKKKEATEIFAQERQSGNLEGIIGNVMQKFGGKDLYPGLEEKASHLLYFIVKNHPFLDGNKRSGAYAFIWFLNRVKLLDKKAIPPPALTAITLLIAESDPKEKDKMTALIVRMLKS